jgi:hypothetical protein
MAEVFVSYSRKDEVFVQRLDAALQQRKHAAWVDWEGKREMEVRDELALRPVNGKLKIESIKRIDTKIIR